MKQDADDYVKEFYPAIWEEMCEMDMYHASEYAEWFVKGLALENKKCLET